MRERLGGRRFNLWLANIVPVDGVSWANVAGEGDASGAEGSKRAEAGWTHYTLAVPTVFVKQWIQDHFLKELEAAFSEVVGCPCTIALVVDAKVEGQGLETGEFGVPELAGRGAADGAGGTGDERPGEQGADDPSGSRRPGPLARGRSRADISGRPKPPAPTPEDGTPLSPRHRLEEFVAGPNNLIAYRCVTEVIDAPGSLYNPLYVYGESGLGKTHLLQALAWKLREQGRRVMHITCEEFINQFVYAVSTRENHNLRRFRDNTRNSDVLLMDDVHLLRSKLATQEEFLHFFDSLATMGRQIVLTADCHPRSIKRLKRELVTRFMAGMVARVEIPNEATRHAILKRKAASMSVPFREGVLRYLAGNDVTSVRELEGLLVRVAAHASLAERDPDVELAQAALEDVLESRPEPVSLRNIEAAVIEYFQVTAEDLRSKKRRKSITFPRQIGMYVARTLTSCSLQEIGNYFGGKNHATVLFAERKITAARQEDPMVDEVCEAILGRFRRGSTRRLGVQPDVEVEKAD